MSRRRPSTSRSARDPPQESRIERTGQTELFAAASVPGGPPSFDEARAMQQGAAPQRPRGLLQANRVVPYDQALAALLEIPLVRDSDVKRMIMGSVTPASTT